MKSVHINKDRGANFKIESMKVAGLIMLFAFILFINLGGWDLWNPDEPRYAQVAREMMQTGQYVLPHINAEIYPDKPPLFFWLIALVSKPFGDVTAFSARFPSALAALFIILLTYFLGRKLYSPLTGFIAALVLFTSSEFFMITTSARIDIPLTLCTTLALFLFFCGYTRSNGRKKYYIASYLCMGLAVLMKGPVGFFVPFISIMLFLTARKELYRLKQMQLGKGLLIVAGIAALWLVPACIMGGEEYTREILGKQIFGRVVSSYSHKKPFYYYLLNFPVGFLPWSLFIPSACIYFWRKKRENLNISFPFSWLAGTFIFFTLISGKRSLYLLPLYPAAAILMAKFFHDHITMEASGIKIIQSKLFKIPCCVFFGLLVLSSIIIWFVIAGEFQIFKPLLYLKANMYPVLVLLCTASLSGAVLIAIKQKVGFLFFLIVTFILTLSLLTVLEIFPSFNTLKSAKPFCRRIKNTVHPDDILIASFNPEMFNYFLNRAPIPEVKISVTLEKTLRSSGKVYCLIREKHYKKSTEELKKMVTILDRDTIGSKTYYLTVNHF